MTSSVSGLVSMFRSPEVETDAPLPSVDDTTRTIRRDEDSISEASKSNVDHEAAEILDVMRAISERLDDQEVKLKAYADVQNDILEKVVDLGFKVEALSELAVSQPMLERTIKPVITGLDSVRAILSAMKASPVMSAAPKRTEPDKGKGKDTNTSPEPKPNEGQAKADKTAITAAALAKQIRSRKSASKHVERADGAGPSTS